MVSSNSPAAVKPNDAPTGNSAWPRLAGLWHRRMTLIAILAVSAILLHIVLRFGLQLAPVWNRIPLLATLTLGGLPLVVDLLFKLWKREFGSDLLGGVSIVASVILGEYLAGSGMAFSLIGMAFAASGHLSPVAGSIAQELIDVAAVLNALRAAFPPKVLHDL